MLSESTNILLTISSRKGVHKTHFQDSLLQYVCGVVRMREVVVYGSASAARSTLEFEMFKHVFLTGPPGKKKNLQASGTGFVKC